jgi:WD40 repeat protein
MSRPCILLASHAHEGISVPIGSPTLSFASAHTRGLSVRLEGQSDAMFDSFRQAGDLAWRVLMCSPVAAARGAGDPSRLGYRLESPGTESLVDQWGSADLAFFATALLDRLALACGESEASISPFAATGHLFAKAGGNADAGIANSDIPFAIRVGGIESKLRAALKSLVPIDGARILIPRDNLAEISSEHRHWVQRGVIVPVHQLEDVLDALRTLPELPPAMRKVLGDLHAPFEGNPYRGIEAFGIEHRGRYFGRQSRIQEIFAKLPENAEAEYPAVLITGFSGSGKSSLLLAGVLGTTLYSEVSGRRFLPSAAQLADTVSAVLRVPARAHTTETSLCEALHAHWQMVLGVAVPSATGLQSLGDQLIPLLVPRGGQHDRWVFALDQLEALVTQVGQDEPAQQQSQQLLERFATFLERLIREAGVWVLATCRPGYLEALGPLWRRVFHVAGHVDLSQSASALDNDLTDAEQWERREAERQEFLHEIIERPAMLAGFALEEGLLEDLMRDARDPQSLPLLEFALQALFESADLRRKRDASAALMTRADYEAIGGMRGAINQRANQLLQLAPDQNALLGVLARMARQQTDATGRKEYVRTSVVWSSLSAEEQTSLEPWLGADNRLLTRVGDLIEVAHEALLREFTALREWLLANDQLLRWRHDHLLPQMRRWQVRERGDSLLLLASEDLTLGAQAGLHSHLLGFEEREFVDASLIAAQRRKVREQESAQQLEAANARAATEQKKALTRTRIGFVVASVLLGLAVLAGLSARNAEIRAATQLDEAASRAVGRADDAMARGDVKSYTAYLAESLTYADNPTAMAGAAMLLQGHGLPLSVPRLQTAMRPSGEVKSTRFSQDSRQVLTVGTDGPVKIWDAVSGTLVRNIDGGESATISNDGRYVATVSEADVSLWDTQSGKPVGKRLQHSERVSLVEWNPDGRVLATLSGAKLYLWDAQSGTLMHESIDLHDRGTLAAFTPDGQHVAAASIGQMVGIWNVQSGTLVDERMPSVEGLKSLQFSPDGRWLVAEGAKEADMWEPVSGKRLGAFYQGISVASVHVSQDGHRAIVAGADDVDQGAGLIWDVDADKQVGETIASSSPITLAQFSPDGRWIATATAREARLWDTQTGKRVGDAARHVGQVTAVDFSPDGRWLLTASENEAQVWETRTGDVLGQPMLHERAIASVAFSPDGRRIVSTDKEGSVSIWNAQMVSGLGMPLRHEGIVNSAEYSPDGSMVVTASLDGTARVWDAKTGSLIRELIRGDYDVNNASFSPDGRLILTASDDLTARLWEARTGESVGRQMEHSATLSRAKFSKDGHWILTVSDDAVFVWNGQTSERISATPIHDERVASAEFSDDESMIVTASNDGVARVWNVQTGALVGEMAHDNKPLNAAAFSPDGRLIVTASGFSPFKPGFAQLWDVSSLKMIGDPMRHDKWVATAEFDRNGTHVLTASSETSAHIWDAATGVSLGKLTGNEYSVDAAQFSPDGHRILTSGQRIEGRYLRLWEARTRVALGGPLAYAQEIIAASFSPDGQWIAASGWDGTARIWSALPDLGADREKLAGALQALSGVSVDANGQLTALTLDALLLARNVLRDSATADTTYDQVIRWHVADPFTRTVSPLVQQTVPQFIESAIDLAISVDRDDQYRVDESLNALEEAYRSDPGHPLILIALSAFEENPKTLRLWKELSLQRVASDARLATRAAELLQLQGDKDFARRTAEIALTLDQARQKAKSVIEWANQAENPTEESPVSP